MDDAEITALAEQLGLTSPLEDVVAWARQRTDEVLANGLDTDLAGLLEGRPIAVDTIPGVVARPIRARTGETQPRATMPSAMVPDSLERLPLPPVPQRPDLAARAPHDSADDMEMLDEDDLELVEDLGEDPEAPADAAAMSSPEWKRALADAQGE